MEEIFPSSKDTAEGGLRYMNAPGPKKRETAMMCELQVLKALDLPSVERICRMLEMMKTYEVRIAKAGVRMLNALKTRTNNLLM